MFPAVLYSHPGESRKIHTNNQAAPVPALLLLGLVEGLPLPLGHLGPALLGALGQPLFSQVTQPLLAAKGGNVPALSPLFPPGTLHRQGQSSLCPQQWGCPDTSCATGLSHCPRGLRGHRVQLLPSGVGLQGAVT